MHVFSLSLILQAEFGRTLAGANASAFFTKGSAGIISQIGFAPTFAGNYTAIGNSRPLLPQFQINGYSSAAENISNHPDVPNSNQYSDVLTKIPFGMETLFLHASERVCLLPSSFHLAPSTHATGTAYPPLHTSVQTDPTKVETANLPLTER